MKITILIPVLLILTIMSGCKKKESNTENSTDNNSSTNTNTNVTVPVLTTSAVTSVTFNSALCGGSISGDGGGAITARGVCWNTSVDPTIANPKTSDGTGTGSFNSSITGLAPNTAYYARAYATNSAGTSYGSQVSFTTLQNNTITDYDGNVYHYITIGTQTWTVENLKVTHYRNGDPVQNVTDAAQWAAQTGGAYCSYSNNSSNIQTYGLLYNWFVTSDSRNIAPAGWRVPTDTDWQDLVVNSGGSNAAGTELKESGTAHWTTGNTGNNNSGFTALPGGYRTETGSFGDVGNMAHFWSATSASPSTTAWYRALVSYAGYVSKANVSKNCGKSIRLIKE